MIKLFSYDAECLLPSCEDASVHSLVSLTFSERAKLRCSRVCDICSMHHFHGVMGCPEHAAELCALADMLTKDQSRFNFFVEGAEEPVLANLNPAAL